MELITRMTEELKSQRESSPRDEPPAAMSTTPRVGRQRKGAYEQSLRQKSLVGSWTHEEFIQRQTEPLRRQLLLEVHPDTQTEREGEKLPGSFHAPTSSQWLPLAKASCHGSLGNSGCRGYKNSQIQEKDYPQNKVDNKRKKKKKRNISFGIKPMLQPLSV